jgi:hypothetical protein
VYRKTIGSAVLFVLCALHALWSVAAFAATDAADAMPASMDQRVRACARARRAGPGPQ